MTRDYAPEQDEETRRGKGATPPYKTVDVTEITRGVIRAQKIKDIIALVFFIIAGVAVGFVIQAIFGLGPFKGVF